MFESFWEDSNNRLKTKNNERYYINRDLAPTSNL